MLTSPQPSPNKPPGMPGWFRRAMHSLLHRHYKSADELARKRAKFGAINEFFKWQVIASDMARYSPPLLCNPFKSKLERDQWPKATHLNYEYAEDTGKTEEVLALRYFDFAYNMVKDRIDTDYKILDVGCNSGFFLDQWYKRGFKNLHGLDPQAAAVEYAHEHRPYLNIKEGFFGPPQNDIDCNLLIFFQSIFRVPYQDRLADAIDRCAKKYVLITWIEDFHGIFPRDLHYELAKKGFLCIEKRVINDDFKPIGTEGTHSPLIKLDPKADEHTYFGGKGGYDSCYTSHFLFRRIEPR